MTASRQGSYQITLLSLIVLVLFTVLFGVLAFTRYQEAERLIKGEAEQQYSIETSLDRQPLTTLYQTEDTLEASIDSLAEQRASLLDVRHDMDLDLARRGIVYVPGEVSPILGHPDDRTPGWKHTRAQIQTELEIIENHQREIESVDDLTRPIDDVTNEFREALNEVVIRIQDVDVRLGEQIERLERKLDELEEAIAQENADFNSLRSSLASEKVQLENEIRELLELRLEWLGELRPDGQVAEVTLDQNTLIIDIGANDRVFNGLRLEIFDYEQGSYRTKGMCEVIETRPTYAICRITASRARATDPIVKGDMIANPVFNTERAPVIVLAGEFKRFNRGDISAFLRRTGAQVEPQLGPNVDYLIAGELSGDEQNLAREYRVTAMREDQLLRFLDTSFEFEDEDQ